MGQIQLEYKVRAYTDAAILQDYLYINYQNNIFLGERSQYRSQSKGYKSWKEDKTDEDTKNEDKKLSEMYGHVVQYPCH